MITIRSIIHSILFMNPGQIVTKISILSIITLYCYHNSSSDMFHQHHFIIVYDLLQYPHHRTVMYCRTVMYSLQPCSLLYLTLLSLLTLYLFSSPLCPCSAINLGLTVCYHARCLLPDVICSQPLTCFRVWVVLCFVSCSSFVCVCLWQLCQHTNNKGLIIH
jgi:hypothetical protein